MHLPLIIFATLYYANVIGPTRVSRQTKDYANTFNNFLQSDFKPINPLSYGDPNKVNIIYKPVEEPVRVEKTVGVPYVKHVPVPVPVYVPQPYPVEKKVFVPYKVYEKQPIPIIHRYPVEKVIRVPVPVPVEQPIGILVPYHVPIEKHVTVATPLYSTTKPDLQLKEVPFTTKDSLNSPKSDAVKFPSENRIFKEEEENSVSSSVLSPYQYNAEMIIPYGTRLSMSNTAKSVEDQENRCTKESFKHSGEVEVITPVPVVENRESIQKFSDSKDVEVNNENTKTQAEDSKEEMRNIVFPTERNDIDKS